MVSVMKVDTSHYRSAATKLTTAAKDADAAFDALDTALAGCGSMAGGTDACLAWAKDYDKAAKAAHAALGGTSDLLTSFSVACLLSAMNHEAAEHASAGKSHEHPAAPQMPTTIPVFPPPSAAGGSGIVPDNWGVIQKVQDIAWPDGDIDKLRAAAHAWGAAASAADKLVTAAGEAKKAVEPIQSGEMGAVEGKFANLESYLKEVAAACRQTGSACAEYADHIEQIHNEVKDILKELAIAAGATIIVGIVLGAVSAGAGAIAAGCVTAAEASAAAARIVVIIGRVATFAAQIGSKITPVAEAVAATGRGGALAVKAAKLTPTLAKYTAIDSAVNVTIDAAEHGGKPSDLTGDIKTAAITSPLGPLGEKVGSKMLQTAKRTGLKLPPVPPLKFGRDGKPLKSGAMPINSFPREEDIFEWAKLVPPKTGYYDVALHGNEYIVEVGLNDGRRIIFGHRDLATLIKKAPDYNGEPIRLLSCKTGGDPEGIAQRLADKLGVPVEAPDKTLWIFNDGDTVVGDDDNNPNGSWRTFNPRGKKH